MSRKRITQMFPFLLPIRKWQRKNFFYWKMRTDGQSYAKHTSEKLLPYLAFETAIPMLNENSGFDMKYQRNKVHNLKLAAKTIQGLLIEEKETFSFWQLVRWADRSEKYKDGLNLVDGKIAASYGGGICMLSDMLFWMFLHTPLTVLERHGHAALLFPSTTEEFPCGTDAAVYEGWLDLKVCNDTDNRFQIEIDFDDSFMYGRIWAQNSLDQEYVIFNSSVTYEKREGSIYQTASVCRRETDSNTGVAITKELYLNRCRIAYPLPEDIKIEEGGVQNA